MPRIAVGALHLFLEDEGPRDGEPVVLLSGVGYGAWFWHKLAPLMTGLSGGLRVLRFDPRGCGQSDAAPGPFQVSDLAEDVVGLLTALDIGSAHVVGHSLGSFVAQELAVRHPSRVRRLALLASTPGGPRAVPMTPAALAVLLDRRDQDAEGLDGLFRRGLAVATAPGFCSRQSALCDALLAYRRAQPVAQTTYQWQVMAGAAYGGQPEEVINARLAAIGATTLVLAGAHDQVTPPGNAALLQSALRDASAQVLPDVGHLFPLEAPEVTAAALRGFLRAETTKPRRAPN